MAAPPTRVAVGSPAPTLVPRRCRAVRLPQSACRDCVQACPRAAVSMAARGPQIDAARCDGCGACVAACATGALSDGLDERLLAGGLPTGAAGVTVRCPHALPAPGPELTVPCLLRVSPELLLFASGAGARPIVLGRGDCWQRCQREVVACEQAVAEAAALAAVGGRALQVSATLATPAVSRRGFFGALARPARELVTGALAVPAALPPVGEPPARRRLLLAALPAPSGPIAAAPRILGRVDARFGRSCDGCGACGRVCATGAITVLHDGPVRVVEHVAAHCDGCGACAAVCGPGALQVGVAREPYDLDPYAVAILGRAEPARCGLCHGPLPAGRSDGLCPACSRRAAMGAPVHWFGSVRPPPARASATEEPPPNGERPPREPTPST